MKQFVQGHTDTKLQSQDWNQVVWLLESLWLISSRCGPREGKRLSPEPNNPMKTVTRS